MTAKVLASEPVDRNPGNHDGKGSLKHRNRNPGNHDGKAFLKRRNQ